MATLCALDGLSVSQTSDSSLNLSGSLLFYLESGSDRLCWKDLGLRQHFVNWRMPSR